MNMSSMHDLLSLQDKVGSGMGIGKAIAQRLHELGSKVVVFDLHQDAAHQTAGELNNLRPDSAHAIDGDVSDERVVGRVITETVEHFGTIDILVNNAGIFPNRLLSDMELHEFRRVIDVNLQGVYLMTRYVSEHMKKHGGGTIVNITSIDALHPSMAGLAHYDASKHAVWGFTKNIAIELAEYNIRVNALAPGGVLTPGVVAMQSGSDADVDKMKKQTEQFLLGIPLHRMADPDEIARMTAVLCSELSSYMTGSQVVVDGGALLG